MPVTANVTIDTRRLNKILDDLPGNRSELVRAMGFSVEAKTKYWITAMRAVDTGSLRSSVYVRTYRSNPMPGVPNPEAGRVELPSPKNDAEVTVGPSVNYAIQVHYGTGSMRARPYLAQAISDITYDLVRANMNWFQRLVTGG